MKLRTAARVQASPRTCAVALLACTLAACIDGRSPAAPTPPPAVPPVVPPAPPAPRRATVEIRNASIGYHNWDAGLLVERLTGTLANTGVDLDGVQLRMELQKDGELIRTRTAWGSPRPLLAGDTLSFSFRTGQVAGVAGVLVINTSHRDVDLLVSALGSQTISCTGWSSRARPSAVSATC